MFIEKLQDIVIEEEFENLREKFCEKYSGNFEEGEENKLIYMDIFKEYVKTVEGYIESVFIYIYNIFFNIINRN
jgi:hypothetical protein